MIDLNTIDTQSFIEPYLVANTPAYLLKKLRANPSVQWLAAKYGASELMELYRQKAAEPDAASEVVALGYAALVAVMLRPADEAVRALESRGPDLDWGERFIEIYRTARPATVSRSTIQHVSPPRITQRNIVPGTRSAAKQ